MVSLSTLNRGIGINNDLPWDLRPDLKDLKLTVGNGNAVLMGRNTLGVCLKDICRENNLVLSKLMKEQ